MAVENEHAHGVRLSWIVSPLTCKGNGRRHIRIDVPQPIAILTLARPRLTTGAIANLPKAKESPEPAARCWPMPSASTAATRRFA